jgi:hypothetical protein
MLRSSSMLILRRGPYAWDPPSSVTTDPVMKLASGRAKCATRLAISVSRPIRPIAIRERTLAHISSSAHLLVRGADKTPPTNNRRLIS